MINAQIVPIIEVVIGLKSGDQSSWVLPSARLTSAVVPIESTRPRPRIRYVERSEASLAHSAARVLANRAGRAETRAARGVTVVEVEVIVVVVAVVMIGLLFRRAPAPSR